MESFGARLANATGKFNATGELEFLNNWKYQMGTEILVPRGRQELFDSGVLHAYMYSSLYDPNTKIIARTTVCIWLSVKDKFHSGVLTRET